MQTKLNNTEIKINQMVAFMGHKNRKLRHLIATFQKVQVSSIQVVLWKVASLQRLVIRIWVQQEVKIVSRTSLWTIFVISHVMINSKIANQRTEKKIIPLNMIHEHLQEIKSNMLKRSQKKSIIKKVQEIDIWLKREVKSNR